MSLRTHACGQLRVSDAGKEVVLSGWVDSFRVAGKISFLTVRDRTGTTQVFLNAALTDHCKHLQKESVVQVFGKVNKRPEKQINPAMHTGEVEVEAQRVEILSLAEAPLPIEIREETTTSLDKRLDYRFLDFRRERVKAIFMIRSKIYTAFVHALEKHGFIQVALPKITESGVESGAEEFKIPYFGKTASLAQSPQIYKQMFVVSGLERVFEIGPVFRAEKSHTTRHLTEFTGIDFEMGFIESEEEVMRMAENVIHDVWAEVKEKAKEELQILGKEITVPTIPFPRVSLHELRKVLAAKGKIIPEDDDPDAAAEIMIGEYIKEKYHHDFVFALDYPFTKRPFYHMRPADDPSVTKSFDLIYRGVEIGTGAQREHRVDVLRQQCELKGLDLDKLPAYRDIFRYGAPPHGGIGLGMDRIVNLMLELGNVREGIPLPRDPDRLTP
ncbi:MAG: aspartate--tRNA(Asn) ligase [Candidatus Iainarchaeum archaeon]|uniref:Aspartate--tRNA ligase n=1 Tax=Candidatus Iainarchaeum sp. TaxID=3101447 RepID=A0A7T9DJH2_9ARCH|nr:MAG: aspartate--tRNA(Asn) ligase [Candidatus Diapherotrites archaeon]